jgi:hypothetical protein
MDFLINSANCGGPVNHYPRDTTWCDLISESVEFNYYTPSPRMARQP